MQAGLHAKEVLLLPYHKSIRLMESSSIGDVVVVGCLVVTWRPCPVPTRAHLPSQSTAILASSCLDRYAACYPARMRANEPRNESNEREEKMCRVW